MKTFILFFLAAILLALIATGSNDMDNTPVSHSGSDSAIQFHSETDQATWNTSANNRNFRAHLNVEQEVPEPTEFERNPKGQAIFQLSRDGSELYYKLIVANIENVTMAHIHLAPVGETGGIIVWLYPEGPPFQTIDGRTDGVLSEGVITGDSLTGALSGGSLSDLVDEKRAGNKYVNVHTSQNPPGEIRGQIF